MKEGRENIKTSLFWKLLERGCSQGITFIITILLARLLEPDEFGTIALLMVFINLMQVFIDSGLGSALIQKRNASDLDYSTVLYFNVFLCILMYGVMYLFAPLIAQYYKNMELTSVIRVLSIIILISGVKNIQISRVASMMEFRKLFYATSIGSFISAGVGIFMAYQGFGIWALVMQNVLNNLISTIMLWLVMKWIPLCKFSIKSLKQLASFGWKVFATSMINTIFDDISVLIIGKKYSTDQLAYYDQGRKYPQVIISNINSSIDSVLFPAMADRQTQAEELKNLIRRSIICSGYLLMPLMTWLAVCSKELVIMLLTEKWLPAAPYILIFCFFYVLYPFNTANINAIKAVGKSQWLVKLEFIKKTYSILILLATVNHGVLCIALGIMLNGFINFIVNALPLKKVADYRLVDEIKDIIPTVLISLVFGLVVYLSGYLPISNLFVSISVRTVLGFVIYLGLSHITKNAGYLYLKNVLCSYLHRK